MPHTNWATSHPSWATPRPNKDMPQPNWVTPYPSWATPHPIWATPHPSWATPHPNCLIHCAMFQCPTWWNCWCGSTSSAGRSETTRVFSANMLWSSGMIYVINNGWPYFWREKKFDQKVPYISSYHTIDAYKGLSCSRKLLALQHTANQNMSSFFVWVPILAFLDRYLDPARYLVAYR